MSDSLELEKLADLHQRGALSDAEFASAKAKLLNSPVRSTPEGDSEAPFAAALNALRRSRDDRWLGGVCGGISRITGLAAWVWRLLFTVLTLFAGTGVLVYLLMWIFVPEE